MKRLILFALLLGCINLCAQDIDAQLLEVNFNGDSYPMEITKFGNKVCFTGQNHNSIRSLHFYDPEQHHLYNLDYSGRIKNLITVGESLFYLKSWMTDELWKSDGTIEGSLLVKNLGYNNTLSETIVFNGKLYFIRNQNNASKLWVSDGTDTGTHILKDINGSNNGDGIRNLFIFNGLLYFNASTNALGNELWKTDGTEAGTVLMKDIATGPADALPRKPVLFNNSFYFLAYTPANGVELWKSDGTNEGTYLFKEFIPGTQGLNINLEALDAAVVPEQYFVFSITSWNSTVVWKSNGTTEGTIPIKTINYEADDFIIFKNFTTFNNTPYFISYDAEGGKEIWKTDGTEQGTLPVFDAPISGAGHISYLSAGENYLIFKADEGLEYNYKPWVSDGTQQGTHLLKDVNLLETSDENFDYVSIGNKIYFPGGHGSLNGVELWYTDGTTQGTKMAGDVLHSLAGISNQYTPSAIPLNDKLIFTGNNGKSGAEPFVSDGTPEGSHILKDIRLGQYGSSVSTNELTNHIYTKAGNKIFFNGRNDDTGVELYVTDGSPEGTRLIKDIYPGTGNGINAFGFRATYNNILYFAANNGINGTGLWRTDGTEEGTQLVKAINPIAQPEGKGTTVYNGFLYFIANDATGRCVWRTDGTEAGTIKVIILPTTAEVNRGAFILGATESKLFLASEFTDNGSLANTLWSSDGTQEGTVLIKTYEISGRHFEKILIKENFMYYTASDINSMYSLFRTDGTSQGTTLIKGNLGQSNYHASFIMSAGNYIYFGLGDDYNSDKTSQLYRTDGTMAGTTLLSNYNAQHLEIYKNFTVNENKLFFISAFNRLMIYYVDQYYTIPQPIQINIENALNNTSYVTSLFEVNNDKMYLGLQTAVSGYELFVANSANILHEIDNPVDLSTAIKEDNFILHPNPANNSVNLSSIDHININSLNIFDIAGKRVLTLPLINDISCKIDISNLEGGIYMVKINSCGKTITKKLIKS